MPSTYTVALVNQKGGVGKTTLSTNLAACAHLRGHRVIVIDLDGQGSALDWYRAQQDGSLLAGIAVAKADRVLRRPALLNLTRDYDLAILDAPPRLDELTSSAAMAADLVLVPIQPAPFDLWAASQTIKTLDVADELREDLGLPRADRIAVLNQVHTGTVLGRQAREAAHGFERIAKVTIHHRIAFATAAANGDAVVTTEPNGPAAGEAWALFELVVAPALKTRRRARRP